MDDRWWRARPLWDWRNIAAESGVVHLVEEDAEEGCCLVVRVWLELGLYLDDERRGHGRKQTSLLHESAPAHTETASGTYEYQRRVQIFVVFLHEFLIVFFGFFAIVLVELGAEIVLSWW